VLRLHCLSENAVTPFWSCLTQCFPISNRNGGSGENVYQSEQLPLARKIFDFWVDRISSVAFLRSDTDDRARANPPLLHRLLLALLLTYLYCLVDHQHVRSRFDRSLGFCAAGSGGICFLGIFVSMLVAGCTSASCRMYVDLALEITLTDPLAAALSSTPYHCSFTGSSLKSSASNDVSMTMSTGMGVNGFGRTFIIISWCACYLVSCFGCVVIRTPFSHHLPTCICRYRTSRNAHHDGRR